MNEESNQQIEKTKVAIQALRKCHSGWDKAKRDWQGALKQSQDCDNTQGTKIEADLKELISTRSEIDEKAMGVETLYFIKGVLTDADIVRGSELIGPLAGFLNTGAQKASALKPWFTL